MLSIQKVADAAIHRFSALEPFPQPEVVVTRYPVLMMHGFGVFGTLRRGGHLHAEAMHLRSHGVLAYAPNVAPYNTVAVRVPQWIERIERILEETGAERLNVIAHSMGGLDARWLISRMGYHDRIASLVTISTPHHGSSVASAMLEQPELIRRFITGMCNWMGTNVVEECEADFDTAVRELTPEAMEERFNPRVPDHPDVRYWSYAGRAGRGTGVFINPFLIYQNNLLYAREGENDGFVSVDSARWGTFMGTYDADHARSVGLNVPPGVKAGFEAEEFYLDVVRMLAGEGL
ncbi:MAG TPA: alpha/beta fold hydrolase [Rhodothermales bacterium]